MRFPQFLSQAQPLASFPGKNIVYVAHTGYDVFFRYRREGFRIFVTYLWGKPQPGPQGAFS